MHIQRTAIVFLCFVLPTATFAGIARTKSSHAVPSILALRSQRNNLVSNIEFYQTNYGELFMNIDLTNGSAGTFWPRGSNVPYIFAGGAWLGAVKKGVRHVLVGYDNYLGKSWFQPGTIAAARMFFDSTFRATGTGRYPGAGDVRYGNRYPVFSSLLYDRTTGRPLNPALGIPNWPIWDTDADSNMVVGRNHYFGNYVDDEHLRDTSVYPMHVRSVIASHYDSVTHSTVTDTLRLRKGGPAFVSEEDLFSVCNDLDTSTYGGVSPGHAYPLTIDLQRTIYTWGAAENANNIVIVYRATNRSTATLDSCWFGPVLDPDIGYADNDENGFYASDPSLNLAMQWSAKEDRIPGAKDTLAYPGVLGLDFLESPTVYKAGEVADSLVGTIKPGVHPNGNQLGLVCLRRWRIGNDETTDDGRYDFMSRPVREQCDAPYSSADLRMLLSTGPFRLLPGQSAQCAYGLMIARDSVRGDTSVDASIAACVVLDKHVQELYDSQYLVDNMSLPPTAPRFAAPTAGDHRVTVHWDSLAEYSYDPLSGGLDFLGYRLYRSRRDNLASRTKIAEWKLTDLDSATFSALRARLPSDYAPNDMRRAFYDEINRYVDSLTHHHTYTDIGDDNHDGVVSRDERLLNSVDYYYWISSFDEGDGTTRSTPRESSPDFGKIVAQAVSSDTAPSQSYTLLDHGRDLGGISHFQWQVQNVDIINQLLSGDTVSVTFQSTPTPVLSDYRSYDLTVGITDRRALISDSMRILPGMFGAVPYGGPTGSSVYGAGDTGTIVPVLFGSQFDTVYAKPIHSVFRSGSAAFGAHAVLLNALTYAFNADFLQCVSPFYIDSIPVMDTTITIHGSTHTADTMYIPHSGIPQRLAWGLMPYGISATKTFRRFGKITGSTRTTRIVGKDTIQTRITQWVGDSIVTGQDPFAIVAGTDTVPMYIANPSYIPFNAQADQGACDYLLSFEPGGTQRVTVKGNDYLAPYLSIRVTCEQIYTVKDSRGIDSLVIVRSPGVPIIPDTSNTQHGHQWTMEPLTWLLSVNNKSDSLGSARSKQYIGYPISPITNRYYLTAPGLPPLDTTFLIFTNRLSIGGSTVFLDSAYKTPNRFMRDSYVGQYLRPATRDLRAGDVLRIRYAGGVMGLPVPGATINTVFRYVAGIHSEPNVPLTPLSSVDAWPNPVYGRREKLALSNLPERCAIELCTITGECIARISHRQGALETIDLAAAGVARRGTQLLIARIVTPDGASRAVKIVVLGDGR